MEQAIIFGLFILFFAIAMYVEYRRRQQRQQFGLALARTIFGRPDPAAPSS